MVFKKGWEGRFYEDFEVADLYFHPTGRTVTEADNIWFSLLTCNMNQLHINDDYSARTEFKKPLVNSGFTLALVLGMSAQDVSENAFANLGWDEVRLPAPLFVGDTVYSKSEVVEKRETKNRKNVGIIRVKTTGFKQDRTVVIQFYRSVMVYKRGQGPPKGPQELLELKKTLPSI